MRRDLPSGTVTFLFTDVEGSTKLLHELGDAYADLLEEHRRVLRDAFARHGGVEVDTQGDAFFVAFSNSIRDTHSLVPILAYAVPVILARGDAVRSAQLCAAAGALSSAYGFELDQDDRRLLDDTAVAAREASGERFEDAWAVGEELELPAAVELALQALG